MLEELRHDREQRVAQAENLLLEHSLEKVGDPPDISDTNMYQLHLPRLVFTLLISNLLLEHSLEKVLTPPDMSDTNILPSEHLYACTYIYLD